MSRSRTLTAAVVTTLLVALLAAMALSASGDPTSPARPSDPAAYGYGPGDGACSFAVCRFIASGRVVDAETGAPIAGATVTLQQRPAGGDWGPPSDIRPAANPLSADRAGRFTWLARGNRTAELRVLAAHAGYVPGASSVRALQGEGYLDVALSPVASDPGDDDGGDAPAAPVAVPDPPVDPAPAPPVSGAGAPTPAPVAKSKGCAAEKGKARTSCLRAQKLATALKSCRTQKGGKRKACEKRARALAACDAKSGKKRAACRTKARAIGRHAPRAKTKATKKSTRR